MKLSDPIAQNLKSLFNSIKALPFSSFGGHGYGGGSTYLPGISLTGSGAFGGSLPGTTYDYATAAGVLWQNPSAAACFVALTKAFAQASPYLERLEDGEWVKVEHHPVSDLLNTPNKFYSGEKMFGVTLISTMSSGAAFWRIELNDDDEPAEIWYEPPAGLGPSGIVPAWTKEDFYSEYFYIVDGQRYPLPLERVVYFRHGLNPSDPREPWGPLGVGVRELATLNGASTYTGSLMRNSAVPSGLISMEGSDLSTAVDMTPEQAESLKRQIKSGFTGDMVGEPFVTNLPLKWTPFNWSPSDLNIDAIRAWPQGTVCALLGTPEVVALLPTGEQPTYQNLEASMKWWWDNTIIPLEDSFADEIETQLFPLFGLDQSEYRLAWDRSRVPALQEDELQRHEMIREDYKSGIIDLHTALTKMQLDAPEDTRGVRHPMASGGGESLFDFGGMSSTGPEAKALTDDEIEAMTDDLTEEDLEAAIESSTPAMRELLRAEPEPDA